MAIHGPIRCSYIERAMCVCLLACVRLHVCVCVCVVHISFWLHFSACPLFLGGSTPPAPRAALLANSLDGSRGSCASPIYRILCVVCSAGVYCIACARCPPGIPLPLPCTLRLPPLLRQPLPRLFSTSSSSRLFQRAAKLRLTHASSPAAAAAAVASSATLPLLLLFFGRCIGGAILAFAFVHSGASCWICMRNMGNVYMVKIIRMKLKANYN